VDKPKPSALVKLAGNITNYHCRRNAASFVFNSEDRAGIGVIAIEAALAGSAGPAIATANATSVEEEADHVTFFLDGNLVETWLWRSPFKPGDFVEIAAEWQNDHYEAFGIARPSDRTVALYPHCSRGKAAHIKNAFFWGFWLGFFGQFIFVTGLGYFIMGPSMFIDPIYYAGLGCLAVFLTIMFTSLARKWLPFVQVAEKVFKALGWPDPGNIDLVKRSKLRRTDKDPGEYGTFYFRY
jgi:hypothetical protein